MDACAHLSEHGTLDEKIELRLQRSAPFARQHDSARVEHGTVLRKVAFKCGEKPCARSLECRASGRVGSIRGMDTLYPRVAGIVNDAAGEAGLGEHLAAVLGLRGGHVKSSAMA
jgi:hypothetical protein